MARTTTKVEEKTASDAPTTKNEVAIYGTPRLPYIEAAADEFTVNRGTGKVLTDSIFPNAKTVESIVMALAYCKSRNLDIMKRVVHIVPMWSSAKGAMIETCWPGIAELRTTATRTGQYAGCEEAEFGPECETVFNGRTQDNGKWQDVSKTVTHPEWCRLTIWKLVGGQKCKFVGPKVKWLEAYASIGRTEVPNDMWETRPEGQLEKCAEAAALRRAFPEELGNELTAEEMHGRRIDDAPAVLEVPANPTQRDDGPPRQVAGSAESTKPAAQEAQPAAQETAQASRPTESPKEQAPQKPAQRQEPAADQTDEFRPLKIPGDGESFESWSAKFSARIAKARSAQEVFGWIDANQRPLDIMAQKGAAHYAKLKASNEARLKVLRDADTKKDAPPRDPITSGPQPSDDFGGSDAPEPDKASKPEPKPAGRTTKIKATPAADPMQPEAFLAWLDERLGKITDPADLEVIYSDLCAGMVEALVFPPDKDEAQAIYGRHEKRLGID